MINIPVIITVALLPVIIWANVLTIRYNRQTQAAHQRIEAAHKRMAEIREEWRRMQ